MADHLTPSSSVDELIARTESCSCADNQLPLLPNINQQNHNELSLIGKIISPRNFIPLVVKEIVEKAWKPSHPIQVTRMDRNIFQFSFGHEVDRHLGFQPKTLDNQRCPFGFENMVSRTHVSRDRFHLFYILGASSWLADVMARAGLHDVWIGLKFEKLSDLCLKCDRRMIKFPLISIPPEDCTETPQRVLNQKEDPPSTALGTPTLSVDTPNDNVGLSSMTREGTEQLDCAPAPETCMKIKDKLECQNAGSHVAIQVCSDSNDTHTGPILPNTHSQIIENPWPNLSQSQVPNTYPLSPIKPNSLTHKPPTDQLPSPLVVAPAVCETVIATLKEQLICDLKCEKLWKKKLVDHVKHVVVSTSGKAGGICLMWSSSMDVQVLEFNYCTIAITIREEYCSWSLIGFYGPPYYAKRRKAWGNLHALLQSINGPWMCFGDFNYVVEESEKEGGNRGSTSTLNFLKELLFELEAIDLGFSGNLFRWWNKRWGRGAIRERLDREISNPSWRLAFPKASVFHLGAINSDHAPDPRCGGVIKEAWKSKVTGSHSFVLCRKQSSTTSALKKWNKDVFGHCQSRIKELTSELEAVQGQGRMEQNVRSESILQGDSKSMWWKNLKQLFTEEEVNFPSDLEHLLNPIISSSKNFDLCRIPTTQEIKCIIFDMDNQKAPGLDGLLALFYKRYWNMVGNTVTEAVKSFFTSSKLLKELIVSRLRPLLDKLISPSQSTFIPGRWIAENQLIVHELLHSFKKRKVKEGFLALKIDLQEAYDWVNWKFLKALTNFVLTNFEKAKKFNEAFIAKLTWMITSKRSSPCMDALRSKYKVTDRWLWEEPRKSASYTWKAVEKMKLLIKKGACFLIGDGLSIDVWNEPWFPWLPNFTPKPKSLSINTWPLKVADLIDQNSRCWINSRLLELRAILFGSPWAIHSHCISIPTCMDIIRFICEPHINPTSPSLSIELSKYSAIQFAITLDCIWNIRNQVVHNDYKINLLAQIKNLECRESIKVNVDAAIFNDKVVVAVVARNHRGYIINAWTKPVEFSDPTVAEASAICWALDLAKDARFESICIESDAKVCIEALTGPLPHCPWKIQA
uniref:RNase H type-1 domain-containing protein n=1 Tax=Fagus sylvatica TaxID=28930 RepID=A0A2N9FNE5_FAGSY